MLWGSPGRWLLTLSLLLSHTLCQNFTVPNGWRKPFSTHPRSTLEIIAQSVIDSLTPLFNATSGQIDALGYTQSANLICVIALHDLIVSNRSNVDTAVDHLQTIFQVHPGYYLPPNWALAAVYAHRAYGDQYLLDIATSVWNEVNTYFITTSNAASGTHATKTVSFQSTCNGRSTAGGVFYIVDNYLNTDVNGATVCGFMALSAHLLDITQDTKYRDAAELSATFIKSQLYNGTIILDTITLNNCDVGELAITYNPGFFIEGLSVYVNITGSMEWKTFLNNLIATTIDFPTWTGEDGVVIEAATGPPSGALQNNFGHALKGIYIRGLYAAWTRSDPTSDVAKLIEAFITVQYNALLELASVPNVYQFSSMWPGPPVDHLLPWGQLAALDVLNAAVGITPQIDSTNSANASSPTLAPTAMPTANPAGTPTAFSSATPSATESATGGSTEKINVGLIVGVTIVAVALVAILVVVVVFARRRKWGSAYVLQSDQPDNAEPYQNEAPPSLIRPFTLTARTGAFPSLKSSMQPSSFNPHTGVPLSSAPFYPSEKQGGTISHTLSHASTSYGPPISQTTPSSGTAPNFGDRMTPDATGSTEVIQLLPLSRPPVDPHSGIGVDTDEPADIPVLIQKLNRALAKLPRGGSGSLGEETELPPEYHER